MCDFDHQRIWWHLWYFPTEWTTFIINVPKSAVWRPLFVWREIIWKAQILSYPTPFQASQYLIFSPLWYTMKAHRRVSSEVEENSIQRRFPENFKRSLCERRRFIVSFHSYLHNSKLTIDFQAEFRFFLILGVLLISSNLSEFKRKFA